MDPLAIPSSSMHLPPDAHTEPPSLRSEERIGEILQDSRENKVLSLPNEDAVATYRPEDFLMLLPHESSTLLNSPNGSISSFQSCCTLCNSCRRILVFPSNTLGQIQCPVCKRYTEIDPQHLESKLLRSCPQCDTLLGNPTNAPRVLCPLCMRLIEWSSAHLHGKESIVTDESKEEPTKKKRTRKIKEMNDCISTTSPLNDTNLDPSSPIDNTTPSTKKKKGYIKKGEPGYIRPKYNYVKKGQPGYIRPKYNYVKKGQPGYAKPNHFASKKFSNNSRADSTNTSLLNSTNTDHNFLLPKIEDTSEVAEAAALLNHAMETVGDVIGTSDERHMVGIPDRGQNVDRIVLHAIQGHLQNADEDILHNTAKES